MVNIMAENDYKINSGVVYPPPPSVATDAEFAAGTSTTASPTVKQCKEKLVTTDTNQAITGVKTFNTPITYQNSKIDITQKPTEYISNNIARALDKNGLNTGWVEHDVSPTADGSVETSIVSRNKDGYQASIRCVMPWEGTSGAFGVAPTPSVDLSGNKITTIEYINTKFQVVSTLPASPNASVFYFIPE